MAKHYLEEGSRVCEGPRMEKYGHPSDNFDDVAHMWSVLLRDRLSAPIEVEDIPRMMIALKLCRDVQSFQDDNWIDIAGFVHTMDAVQTEQDSEE